jgi:signal transduction histidine kinase
MLGRQQIAGIPTAISELFKNAHDAYADNAIVDYFRSDGLFVLRDDGIGMTQEDFEERWLTLGTESKLEEGGLPDLRPADREPRAVLGEKGIGRLAIAAIGPQVLVVSRALRDGVLIDPVTAFLHWGLYEIPGVDLDAIDVPLVSVSGGEMPGRDVIARLLGDVRKNCAVLRDHATDELIDRIETELDEFLNVDPIDLRDVLTGPKLTDHSGTQFYIKPSSPLLAEDLDETEGKEAPDLLRTLVGFSNTMTEAGPPVLSTSFRHHWTDDAYEDVIGIDEFFTPEEFAAADQHIHGEFDRFGQFDGTVSVYGEAPEPYSVAWQARGAPTRCGSFRLDLAYVQGRQGQSKLEPDAFADISRKLDRFGGLYIYRDDVRVLPYGNSDFDWLDVERRRTISASDYYFSYRRMFGVVAISRADNHELREKAGREGFAANQAYRQFRDILKNFLYRVAFDFFRDAGGRSEKFFVKRGELERLEKARERRAKQVTTKRRALRTELNAFNDRVEAGEPAQAVEEVLTELSGRIQTALRTESPSDAARELVEAETKARDGLALIADSYELRRPRGVGLTRELTRLWQGYEVDRADLGEGVFQPAERQVENLVESANRKNQLAVDRRLRFDAAVDQAVAASRESARSERRALQAATKHVDEEAVRLANQGLARVDAAIQEALAAAARLDVLTLSDDQFVAKRSEIEDMLETIAAEQTRALQSVTEQLEGVTWPQNGTGDYATALDEVEVLEADLEALRESASEDLELRQMGLAVEVINHEFRSMVRQIRRNLQRLGEWAQANPALREPYSDLRSSFDHLDAYLRLFTPLHRRLERGKVAITGRAIHKYLRDLFGKRLKDMGIQLRPSDTFLDAVMTQYPSTVYPVFVNLVDNALYWLSEYRGPRQIDLDAGDGWLSVEDSGPGVPSKYRDAIFEQGFTEKPGGTGLGLYIAREVLSREGIELHLAQPSADAGARFVITLSE